MRLAKSTMRSKARLCSPKKIFPVMFMATALGATAQDNSPYSRFGLGDQLPSSNVTTRGMGGISAGYVDAASINFNNPASYSQFGAYQQKHSAKLSSGRAVFDVGINLDNRSLIEPNTTNRSSSSDLFFNYIQLGLPLRKGWGLSFGLRPLSRISYNVSQTGPLHDPVTGNYIDSVTTNYKGSGGSFLPSIGTGFAIGNLSLGVNVGYLFGTKQITTQQIVLDTFLMHPGQYSTASSFGGLFYTVGAQYKIKFNKDVYLRLGASGNWQQNIHGTQDVTRETYTLDASGGILRTDSVYSKTGTEGQVVYPSNYRVGFVLGNDTKLWLFGVDYITSKWSQYRFFGQTDYVQDSWQLSVGGQFFPKISTAYFSQVAYRFGVYTGTDYINVQNSMPKYGASFGMGLPVRPSRMAPGQISFVNLGLEYMKRGNNNNPIKENIFRLSVGFSLTDLWFIKRKYE